MTPPKTPAGSGDWEGPAARRSPNHYRNGRALRTRLYGKLRHDPVTGCLEWQGYVGNTGYGQIGHEYKVYSTHRVAWEMENGAIPAGMFVCHSCDNRICCNPGHLFIGTHSDNMRDMHSKGRAGIAVGEASPNAKVTDRQVDEIRLRYRPNCRGLTKQLADEYGITTQHVRMIAQFKWRRRTA